MPTRTTETLVKQALSNAAAGADCCPIGHWTDKTPVARPGVQGHMNTLIMAYAKYASSYWPFRDAGVCGQEGGDKKTYQMDPANLDEAAHECALDLGEGADMTRPACPTGRRASGKRRAMCPTAT